MSPVPALWWKMNARSQYFFTRLRTRLLQLIGDIATSRNSRSHNSCLQSSLFPFLVALFRMLSHDCASSYFFRATAVAPAFLGTFLDVFVLTLLFCADTLEMFLTRHADLHASYLQSLSHSHAAKAS